MARDNLLKRALGAVSAPEEARRKRARVQAGDSGVVAHLHGA